MSIEQGFHELEETVFRPMSNGLKKVILGEEVEYEEFSDFDCDIDSVETESESEYVGDEF